MCRAFIRLVTAVKSPRVNVHYVSSVCEEIGLVGGRLASYAVHPDIGISCDVAFASDMQGDDAKVIGDIRLGAGGALAVGPIYHRGLCEHFLATAQANDIPLQVRGVPKGMGNNGWALKMEHGGAAVVQIAIPLRYMHSPVEVIDLKDVDSVTDLVVAAVLDLDDSFELLPEQP
jgi:endoglucanase